MSNLELIDFDGRRLDGLVFCAQVYDFFEQIRRADGGISELRMRSTERAKWVLEELLPICKYVQAKYRQGLYLGIAWVNGDQSFD